MFDVDQFPDLADAVLLAKGRGIRVAVSNPCFELWLLLHFEEHPTHSDGYGTLRSKLGKHVPGHRKAVDFDCFREHVSAARDRAHALEPTGEDHGRNPSTGMWMLVDRVSEEWSSPA